MSVRIGMLPKDQRPPSVRRQQTGFEELLKHRVSCLYVTVTFAFLKHSVVVEDDGHRRRFAVFDAEPDFGQTFHVLRDDAPDLRFVENERTKSPAYV